MGEWKTWNRAIRAHSRLLLSGTGSIALGVAQYFLLGFVRDAEKLRTYLLVLFPSVAVVCFYFTFFYTWRDEDRKVKKLEPLASAFHESLKRKCDELIVGWADLDRQFLEAPENSTGIQGPLDPGWRSSHFFIGHLKYVLTRRNTTV